MLAIRLPPEIESRLTALAQKTGRTKTFYARQAILAHLENLEDAYLAQAEYEAFRASGRKAIPGEDVERERGLAD